MFSLLQNRIYFENPISVPMALPFLHCLKYHSFRNFLPSKLLFLIGHCYCSNCLLHISIQLLSLDPFRSHRETTCCVVTYRLCS